MYTLEFYDKIRDIERQYHFSHPPISPQQALDIFSKMGFEVYPYGAEQNPLIQFADKKDERNTPQEFNNSNTALRSGNAVQRSR